jgi:hypothetical protein
VIPQLIETQNQILYFTWCGYSSLR